MQYQAPQSVEEAVALLGDGRGESRVLAGGTDLLIQLQRGQRRPDLLVDVKRIPRLTSIDQDDGGFRIGSAVCAAEIGEHAALRDAWPGVVEAIELIGSTQIQGRATVGGNLCNGSPAADTAPALIAAGARCVIAGGAGEREVAVEEIVLSPGRTCLASDEILVELLLPARPLGAGDAYLRMIPRSEMDIAIVGAGVSLVLDASGRCTDARVALGAVAPTPLLVSEAAEAIVGHSVDDAALERLSTAASAAARPIDDLRGTVDYRTRVAGVLARRAAAIARDRALERR